MRPPTSLVLFALVLLILVPQGSVSASLHVASTSVPTVILQEPPADASAAVQGSTGLPQRAPDPRTLEDYWPVFAAFVLTWIAIVAYWLTFGRRVSRIADEMAEIAGPEGG